jgi:hypothetical protein
MVFHPPANGGGERPYLSIFGDFRWGVDARAIIEPDAQKKDNPIARQFAYFPPWRKYRMVWVNLKC